jgi:ABC-type glycerol-3-phosphate transport system substrate-binding protein
MQQIALAAFGLMLLLTLPVARRFRTRLGLAGAAALLIVAAGCSNAPPTAAGTYPVTITGTSGALSHSITVNVTVN